MGIPMLKIGRSQDRLIFNMGIRILVRRHLYIETAPRVQIQRASKRAHEEKERWLAKQARLKEECVADTLEEGPTYAPGGF